ncbi:hypothetical protein C8R43DRAFT_1230605 [Mycena crocata]|nr:hypothetical protein C8R43DRAFT_1230605 [Mycena crocata]
MYHVLLTTTNKDKPLCGWNSRTVLLRLLESPKFAIADTVETLLAMLPSWIKKSPETLISYLESDSTPRFAKVLILEDLSTRKERLRGSQAPSLNHEYVLPTVIRLLNSSEGEVVDATRRFLRNGPLSNDFVDVLMSENYLRNENLPTSTRVLILEDLSVRAEWEVHAVNLAQKHMFGILLRLAASPEIEVAGATCTLIGTLLTWKSVADVTPLKDLPKPLLVLANPSDPWFHKQTIYALNCLCKWESGASVLAQETATLAERILQPSNVTADAALLGWTCRMLGNCARYGNLTLDDDSPVYEHLDSLLEHPEPAVQEDVLYALSCMREAHEPKNYIQTKNTKIQKKMGPETLTPEARAEARRRGVGAALVRLEAAYFPKAETSSESKPSN